MAIRREELGAFLRSRRARLSPSDVGLAASGSARRVSGLRREELAHLAGVSPDYYARLEQGRATNVSDQVLGAVADALRLDDVEREHLMALIRSTGTDVFHHRPHVRPALRSMISALDPIPAMLHDPRLDVLATNRAAAALIADFDAMPPDRRNLARWMFGDPRAREVYVDWEEIAAQIVAVLRLAAGVAPTADVTSLVDELCSSSTEFARYWSDQRLHRHTCGPKRFCHPVAGEMTLNYETLHLAADVGLSLVLYTADPGSPSEAALRTLGDA